ncbi:tetratricopeptide (TPR) repeat protein [Saccharothrix tamanrassetensis]|uniref:Tetratricopeptide (TPR) repeat protein n=1 Tax=Saccharothrix tamanrassetensis TaxID=1051531 RepID=A0A841CIT1_9PSEU|nr:tetratricopeptide repeat protein [Saccharothrix tamanrassetensis]MBB5955915.1 tetratricopeptide (TPR) repeat protein [Saccharothrix tamanrassetensis]
MCPPETAPKGATANEVNAVLLGAAVQAENISGGVHLHVPATPDQPAPRQLPARPRSFTGRDAELAALTEAVDGDARATVAISAIGGMGGIGKTSLALHWAHENRGRFPDGQLYVNLRGFDPADEPLEPAVAVRGFLDALHVAPHSMPADLDGQAALYRTLVADRRMLVVLDNAVDEEQVIPLLPGSETCTVLVTSRRALDGLATAHGARLLSLDVLTTDAAKRLLVGYLGTDRVDAEPDAVRDLIRLSGRLPLALSILAARASQYRNFPLEEFVAELRDAEQRLDAFHSRIRQNDLRAVFDSSYRALSESEARLFRMLGEVTAPDTTLPAVANLARTTDAESRRLLRNLVDAHLVENHAPGRYRMHDLVRLWALEKAEQVDDAAERTAAQQRLVDFYVHSAVAASAQVDGRRRPTLVAEPGPDCRPSGFRGRASALAWLDAEHACLLAACRLAVARGWHSQVWQLAYALDTFHWRRGHVHDHFAMWQDALGAARALGDDGLTGRAHRYLGYAASRKSHHREAVEHLTAALHLAEQVGDVREQARAHQDFAYAWEVRNDYSTALEHAMLAIPLFRSADSPMWEARALNLAGSYQARLGDHETARALCGRSLELSRELRDLDGEAASLDCLADVHIRSGEHATAAELFRDALRLRQQLGNAYGAADSLAGLGRSLAGLGEHREAREILARAHALYRSQHRPAEADAVRDLMATIP